MKMTIKSFTAFKFLFLAGTCFVLSSASLAQTSFASSAQCSDYKSLNAEASLASLNPAPQTISGIQFPERQKVLYRGITESNNQFNLESVLRAIFHEPNWYLGSPLFIGITEVLRGERKLDQEFFPSSGLPFEMKAYFKDRNMLKDIEALLKCKTGHRYSKTEAESLAANLLNKYFVGQSAKKISDLYLNIKRSDYYEKSLTEKGFGNKSIEFIVGSSYDQVAALYGKKILIYKDTRNRGIDLSFWNKKHNSLYWDSWVDSGEVDIPGYLTGDEILGYEERTRDRDRSHSLDYGPDGYVDIAYFRATIEGERVVLVIDGGSEKCLIQGSDQRVYTCNQDKWDDMRTDPIPYPVPQSEKTVNRASLLGVISTCENDKCPAVRRVMTKYGTYSDQEVPSDVIAQVNRIKVAGKKLHFTVKNKSSSPPNEVVNQPKNPNTPKKPNTTAKKASFTGIKIISATYLPTSDNNSAHKGNVTSDAAAYCNGKSSVHYKIAAKFLHIPTNSGPRAFKISWACPDSPTKIKELNASAPAEGKFLDLECSPN